MRLGTLLAATLLWFGFVAPMTDAAQAYAKPAFSVTSIKPSSKTEQGWKLAHTADGFTARNVTVRMLIRDAYQVYGENQILGGPKWVDSQKYDVEAKVDDVVVRPVQKLDLEQRQQMLRSLLIDRFKLRVHMEPRDFSAYKLVCTQPGSQAAGIQIR